MQNRSDKKFDEFIRSEMEDLKTDASFDEQWDKMSSSLDKKSFMHLSFYRFNIYYLSVLGLSLALLVFWFFSKNDPLTKESFKEKTEIKKEPIAPVTILPEGKSSNGKKQPQDLTVPNIANRKKESFDISNTQTRNDLKTEIEIKQVKDTVKTLSPVVQNNATIKPDSLAKAKPVVPKKIKYITKRDTIINIDNTKVRKKR